MAEDAPCFARGVDPEGNPWCSLPADHGGLHSDMLPADFVDEWREKAALFETVEYLLRKVVDYWDGRPLTHHGDHIYADLRDVLRAITPVDKP